MYMLFDNKYKQNSTITTKNTTKLINYAKKQIQVNFPFHSVSESESG